MVDVMHEKCVGCKACGDICPVNAIVFKEDRYGFQAPIIDNEKCIRCKKCINICPVDKIYEHEKYKKPQVYAAWLYDDEMRKQSTSGGVYYALATYVLRLGGKVVACQYAEDWKSAEHVMIDNEADLTKTMGSKYFQSDTSGIYKKIKIELEAGTRILFCGSPCQSAALKNYLGKEYDKLITMDYICRGNNSPMVYRAFLEELETRYKSKIKSVQFKNKRNGWKSLSVLIQFENGEEYYDTKLTSYWTLGYIRHNLYMRPSCHECRFRTIPRKSDFTVGDFWGIKKVSEEDEFKGVSVVFANTKTANEILNDLQEMLHLESRSLEEVLGGNVCIYDSPKVGEYRESFFDLLESEGFTEAIAKTCERL